MIVSSISMLPWILTLDLSWLAWCFVGFLGNPQHLSYFYLLEPCSEEQHQRRDYSHQWHVVYMWQFICKKIWWNFLKSQFRKKLSINISSVTYIPWSVHSRCNCRIGCWLYPRPYSWGNSRWAFWLWCRFQIINLKLDCFCGISWHN